VKRLVREQRAGCIALEGDIVLMVDGQTVLVKRAAPSTGP
jgi:hypothetical protein